MWYKQFNLLVTNENTKRKNIKAVTRIFSGIVLTLFSRIYMSNSYINKFVDNLQCIIYMKILVPYFISPI